MEAFDAGAAIVTALGGVSGQLATIIPVALGIAVMIWATTLGKGTAKKVAK